MDIWPLSQSSASVLQNIWTAEVAGCACAERERHWLGLLLAWGVQEQLKIPSGSPLATAPLPLDLWLRRNCCILLVFYCILLYFTAGFHRHGSMHKTGNLSMAKVKRGFPKFFFSLMESPSLSYSKPAWMWCCSRWACCARGWAHEVQRSLPTPGTPDPTLQPLGNCDLQPLTWINGWKSSSSKWLLLLLSVLRSPISPSTKTLV